MDTRTGEIKYLTPDEAKRAQEAISRGDRPHRDRLVPVPEQDMATLHDMNRKERRTWAAQKRSDERRRLKAARAAAAHPERKRGEGE